jgi:hypothetical protein
MAQVTATRCDCCGEHAQAQKTDVAVETGDRDGAGGVELRKAAKTTFFPVDGSRHVLPPGWWIFELTTFGDVHVVADICDNCAKMFKAYLKRRSKLLAKKAAALLVESEGVPAPKALPEKPKTRGTKAKA